MENPLAVIAEQIPQAAGLFFLGRKERPKEAPLLAFEKKHCNEELKSIARIASKKN